MAADRATDIESAAKVVAESDAGRRNDLKQFYGVGHESPADHDIVVNTGRIDPEAFVSIVVNTGRIDPEAFVSIVVSAAEL